jgi:hypothetical protein
MYIHVEEIVRVESSVGDENKKGTLIYLQGRSEPRCFEETAKNVRKMIEEEKSKEEIKLEVIAIGLLLAAHKSADCRLHFEESVDGLIVTAGGVGMTPLQGRDRSKYEHAQEQLSGYALVKVEPKGVYRLSERGHRIAEFLVDNNHPEDEPFSGFVKLPPRITETPSQIGVQINQYNYNKGIVNNTVLEQGNVVQSVTMITGGTATTKDRLFIDDIESFSKVRAVAPATVAPLLKHGYLNMAEDVVQKALEEILAVPLHKKDWGGEVNDLYTGNVLVDGVRRPTAFLLKGRGLKAKKMEIRDCGTNGDQIVRLFQSPADLFVIQFVGNIAEAVIQHAHGEIARLKTQGKDAHFLTLDGQDTARLLTAYGKLTPLSAALLPALPPG